MNKQKTVITVLFLVLVVNSPFSISAQEDEVTTTESVRVVNVEVPVRVFYKDSPVDGLKKNQFRVYENGRLQEINGFYIRKKRLTGTGTGADLSGRKRVMNSRYFVLVFRITQYNDQLHKGLEYLFENVFRESDQCLAFINDKSIFLKDLTHMENARSLIQRILREESRKARLRLQKYLTRVEDEVKLLRFRFEIVPMTSEYTLEVWRFLHRYLEIWNEYDNIYLKPNLDNYFYFSRHLEKIKKEKWVINFYQIEKFPKLKQTGYIMEQIRAMFANFQMMDDAEYSTMIKALSRLFRHIDIEMHATRNFPADEISKLFMKVDATFHSILIPVIQPYLSEDIEYQEVSSELESSLREITRSTGGSLQRTGNLETALGKIEEKEDVTYMLTYSPDNPDKVGKIRVKVDNKKFRILYDDQMRADYIREYLKKKKLEVPDIRILKTDFRDRILTVDVIDFVMSVQDNHTRKGRIFFEIEILDSGNNLLFDRKKTMVADRDRVSVSVDFPWLKKGKYNLIVQVTDMQTGKTSSDFLHHVIR